MPPPPPTALPKSSAPSAPTKLPGAPPKPAGYAAAPTSLPGAGAPAAPTGLPGGASLPKPAAAPAPTALPGAKAPPAPSSLPAGPGAKRSAPPPPRALPSVSARAGPSDSGFSAPSAPSSLPEAPTRKAPGAPTALPGASPPAAPVRPVAPAPPVRPAPASSPSSAGYAAPTASQPEPQTAPLEEEDHDESWRQYIEEDSEDSVPVDSGDDSDADTAAHSGDRHKNDMELLLKMQAKAAPKDRPKAKAELESDSVAGSTGGREEEASLAWAETGKTDQFSPPAIAGAPEKKKGIMSRLFGGKKTTSIEIPPGTSMLGQDLAKRNDAWYEDNLSHLGKEGLRCTKVGTNGKPYERFVYLDSRNLTLEIRGGRSGTSGVMMDDLVDIRQGLNSPDFEQFLSRLNMDPTGLDSKSLVLQTPHRTFSFIMNDRQQRDNIGLCILYLLKIKNRGVMAASSTSPSAGKSPSVGPKTGSGKVVYQNRSSYEGQFHNYMRHGQGTLTLSDGTKYVAQWKNDERHGEGRELCPDGTTFEGHYVAGMRHGYGIMKWPEGSKYSGMFERGRANGQGELLRTDGSVYRGQFCEDCMSGEGRMQWRDGVEYVGQFVANKREGYGKMTWTSGRWKKYEGHWKDGMQHEIGTLLDHQDQEFRGCFKYGKLEYWIDDHDHKK